MGVPFLLRPLRKGQAFAWRQKKRPPFDGLMDTALAFSPFTTFYAALAAGSTDGLCSDFVSAATTAHGAAGMVLLSTRAPQDFRRNRCLAVSTALTSIYATALSSAT